MKPQLLARTSYRISKVQFKLHYFPKLLRNAQYVRTSFFLSVLVEVMYENVSTSLRMAKYSYVTGVRLMTPFFFLFVFHVLDVRHTNVFKTATAASGVLLLHFLFQQIHVYWIVQTINEIRPFGCRKAQDVLLKHALLSTWLENAGAFISFFTVKS